MKFKLTLKASSFFFANQISLIKNVTQEVDSDTVLDKDISILNAYIKSGAIISDNGLLPVVEVLDEPEVIVEEVVQEVAVIEDTVVVEETPVAIEDAQPVEEAEVKKKPVKKAVKK